MSQFRIKGIDYADEDLQHGLGIGSGRGRPKGSKNGQVMPGAAYMKNYKIVGEKAEGTDNLPGAQNANRRLNGPINPNLESDYRRSRQIKAVRALQQGHQQNARRAVQQARPNNSQLMSNVYKVKSNSNQRGTLVSQPSENVSKGRDLVNRMMGEVQAFQQGHEQNAQRAGSNDSQLMSNVYKVKSNSNQRGTLVPQVNEVATPAANAERTPSAERQFVNELLRDARTGSMPERLNLIRPVESTGTRSEQPSNGSTTERNSQPEQPAANAQQGRGQTPPASNQQAQGQTPPAQQTQGQTPQAQQRQETPEQKSFWDNVGGWFAQAGKDIGNTVVGALNTAGGAVSDAANWVGNRLKEGGEWALASMGDVGEWVGDRAKDLDAWWNGRDYEVNDNGRERQAHQPGAREAIEDWWNGRDTVNIQDGTYRRNHEAGARENIGNALNAAGQWIGNSAGDVGRTVGGAANGLADDVLGRYQVVGTDENGNPIYGNQRQGGLVNQAASDLNTWWNGTPSKPFLGVRPQMEIASQHFFQNLDEGLNKAYRDGRQLVGDSVRDVRNFVNGIQPGSADAAPYWDVRTGEYVVPTITPGLGERVADASNEAKEWVNDNVVVPVQNASATAGEFVRTTADDANNLWNTNVAVPMGNTSYDVDGYNIRSLARQSSAYQNAPAQNRAQVERDFTDRYTSARNSKVYQAALTSGMPESEARQILTDFAGGNIDSAQFVDELNRISNLYANVYNR